jgi:hypothetical protein
MTGLTRYQVLAIALFVALKKSRHLGVVDLNLEGPSFPLDLQSKVFWAAQTGDYWKLKQLLAPLLSDGATNTDDDSLVPLSFVFKNVFCRLLRGSILADPRHLCLKKWVVMTYSGQNTMFPVKHCRWCGLLNVKEFRVCSMCQECPEYHDRHHFCSEKCEKEALDKQHREEHARFFLVKLNMDSS